jgi:hypothetical protein
MSSTRPMRPLSPAGAHISRECVMCGGKVFERLQRKGFLQEHILPFFNLYPWRCAICHKVAYVSKRSTKPDLS